METMELKDFIKDTLIQIVSGVDEAQEAVADKAVINPVNDAFELNRAAPVKVFFDVALTVTESAGGKAVIGIFTSGLSLGVKGGAEVGSRSLNRVQFNVPVILPEGKLV